MVSGTINNNLLIDHAVTLVLIAFACVTLALSLVDDATERGAMVITAMAFSVFEIWLCLLVGIIVITA